MLPNQSLSYNPSQSKQFFSNKRLRLIIYYFALVVITLLGVLYGFYFSEIFFDSNKPLWLEQILNGLKLFWLIPLPYALLNFYSFLRYPVFQGPRYKSWPAGAPPHLAGKLIFRYVTRGHSPNLVSDNVRNASHLLQKTLPLNTWAIEIVTDNPLPGIPDAPHVRIIEVPAAYKTKYGSLYKARALQYALNVSPAQPEDWIIHLDEETQFDAETVRAIYCFAARETHLTAQGHQKLPRIGQGVILYGARTIVNRLTTLADSIRVGDDYGRFRLQYENGKAYFGIHGSYIVVNNRVEYLVGMDHGPEASITEDAYFALMAQNMGVKFSFIHTVMYEKSPFSIRDFMRQRRRWFGGLWLVALSRDIPLRQRWILITFMILWSVSWLCIWMVFVNLLYPTGTPLWLAIAGGVSFAYYVTLYLIGYLRTFRWNDGCRRFIIYLFAQLILIPVFSLIEAGGVFYGLISPPHDFQIVQKEIEPQASY